MKAIFGILAVCLLFTSGAFAEVMTVVGEKATIYSKPDESSPAKGVVKSGKSVRTFSQSGDFFEVKLKSGQSGWIKVSDLQAKEIEVEGEDSRPKKEDDFKRWALQFGVSSGSSNGKNYTEVNLGVGYYFFRWLEWQNSAFASLDRTTNVYGLDSSLRGVLNTDLGGIAHIHAFAGPGYRFASDALYNTVFAEAGLITSVSGFSLGGGVRQFYYALKGKDSTGKDYQNESQYFIILSGSASF